MTAIRYVKQKREKVGLCTICKRVRELTYDHIPPKTAGNVNPVMLVSAISAISGRPQEDRPLISQNGYKVRSVCRDCNSAIGQEYDPVIGKLCADIKRYLESPLTLPAEATFDTIPSRLIRGLLSHFLAAKLSPDECVVDQRIREFLVDYATALDCDLHLYCWLYPYPQIKILRDFATKLFTGRTHEIAFCSVMKFPPIGVLLTDSKYFHGLQDLAELSQFGINDPGRIHFRFDNLRPADWPEGTDHSGFVMMGAAGTASLYSTPRKR